MAKPRLEKVEALFYVLKQVAKGGCIRILIHPRTKVVLSLSLSPLVSLISFSQSLSFLFFPLFFLSFYSF